MVARSLNGGENSSMINAPARSFRAFPAPLLFRRALRGAPLLLALMSTSLGAQQSKSQPAPLPTPESSFGFPAAADSKLFDYEQSIAYFRRLAASRNRLTLTHVRAPALGPR